MAQERGQSKAALQQDASPRLGLEERGFTLRAA